MPLLPAFFTVLVGPRLPALVPLPLPFVTALSQLEIDTSTERASMFRLRFDLSQTQLGDWDVLQIDIFRPMVCVQIRVHLGRGISEPIINGYVHSATLDNRTEPGRSTLEIAGMDATATRMNIHEKSMPWPNLPDSVIAMGIFGQYEILPSVFPTPSTRVVVDTTTIARTTDARILQTMARRNAFECYVQPDPILGIDLGHFHPPQLLFPPQGVMSVNFGAATNMERFDVRYEMLEPTSALAVALDDTTKVPIPGIAPVALDPPMGLEPTLLRVLPPPIVRPAGTDAANPAELQTTAQSIANRSSRCIRGSGEVDGLRFARVLRPGLPLLVRGAGFQHSGRYYVTEVSHSISTMGYTQRFVAWRNAVGMLPEPFVDPMAVTT